MATHTVAIDVIDISIPEANHKNIPIINKPNRCYGYNANAKEVWQLIQLSRYNIYEAGTNKSINGNNYYDYFPEEEGGGGGGGTSNYNDLSNRPSVNNTVLAGNKTSAQLGLASSEQVAENKNNISSLTQYGGGINKFQVTATSTTINGITFTVNTDKTITATGSIADSSKNAIFTIGTYTAVSGDVLSEGFTEASRNAYVYARGGSTNLASEPYKAILAGDIGVQREYACVITANTVGQVNITFKPMICNSNIYAKSSVYQPYAMSNAELTAAIQALQAQLGNTTIKIITKTEYDSIPHAANTVYYVKDGDKVVQYLGDAKFGTGSISGSSSLYGVAYDSINGDAEFSEIS